MDNNIRFNFKTRYVNGEKQIFDPIRVRYVAFTEEEIIRQVFIDYLLREIHVPKINITVEKKITYNTLTKRYDIVVFDSEGSILILVECKAPSVSISENTLAQISMYNHTLQSKYIVLYNGKNQYVYQKNTNGYMMIEKLPPFEKM